MFCKDYYSSEEIKEKFNNINSLEFSIAVKENMPNNPIEIKAVTGFNQNNEKEILEYIPYDKERKLIYKINDYSGLSKYTLDHYQKIYNNHSKVSVEDIAQDFKIKDKVAYEQAKEITKGVNVLKEEIKIKDKENNEYTIKIFENSDLSLGGFLMQDKMLVYSGEEQIGYIKMKYSTSELYDTYYPTKLQEALEHSNENHMFNHQLNKKEILEILEERRFIYDVNYNEIENEFKQAEKKIFKRYKNLVEDLRERWINTATSEYSRLDPEYQGKGISQLMYFHMSKYLNKKNIKLRGSTCQSDFAKRLWENLETNFPDNISKIKLPDDDRVSYVLIVEDNENAYFKNGKLIKENLISKFLNDKQLEKSFLNKKKANNKNN
jgi:hypothetical protein